MINSVQSIEKAEISCSLRVCKETTIAPLSDFMYENLVQRELLKRGTATASIPDMCRRFSSLSVLLYYLCSVAKKGDFIIETGFAPQGVASASNLVRSLCTIFI